MFSWDDSAARVKTSVAGLKFSTDTGTELKVNGLADDIVFDLPMTSTTQPIATHVRIDNVEKRNNDLAMHNITFSPPTTAIEFRIVPGKAKQMFDLFIKLDSTASDTDYDIKARVTESVDYSYLWIVPPSNGTYYVAVRQGKQY